MAVIMSEEDKKHLKFKQQLNDGIAICGDNVASIRLDICGSWLIMETRRRITNKDAHTLKYDHEIIEANLDRDLTSLLLALIKVKGVKWLSVSAYRIEISHIDCNGGFDNEYAMQVIIEVLELLLPNIKEY